MPIFRTGIIKRYDATTGVGIISSMNPEEDDRNFYAPGKKFVGGELVKYLQQVWAVDVRVDNSPIDIFEVDASPRTVEEK